MHIAIITAGCSHNLADSETMAHYLDLAGHSVSFEKTADVELVVYNTCTVKAPSEDKFFTQLKLEKLPVVICGCISQSQMNEDWLKEYSAVGVDQLDKIVEAVEKTSQGKVFHALNKKRSDDGRDFIPLIRKNKYVGIIPVLQGCAGSCNFCKTKFARGHLKSYSSEKIIEQIRLAKAEGIKEIWLVSQDNGAYGLDIGTTLPELLEKIADVGDGLHIRVGMLNPEYAYEYRKELVEVLKNDCFYKFLHIPVQCGSNSVLKDMNRPYTVEEFEESIKVLLSGHPYMSIATDIICGYPTESPSQFEETMELVKRHKFSMVNISKFYPRPGTKAAKLKHLSTKEVKVRSKKLNDWFESVNYNEDLVGEVVECFVTEKDSKGNYIAKTKNYKQVVIRSDEDTLGKTVSIKVESTTRDDLRGYVYFE